MTLLLRFQLTETLLLRSLRMEVKYIDSVTETTNSTEVVQYLSSAGQSAATFHAKSFRTAEL